MAEKALSTSDDGATPREPPNFPASFPPDGLSDARAWLADPKILATVSIDHDFADCHLWIDKLIYTIAFASFLLSRWDDDRIPRTFSVSWVHHVHLTIRGKSENTLPRHAGSEPRLAPHAAGAEWGKPRRGSLPADAGGEMSLPSPPRKVLPRPGNLPTVPPFSLCFSGYRRWGESGPWGKALRRGMLFADLPPEGASPRR